MRVQSRSLNQRDGCVWSHHHTHLLRHSLAFLNETSPVSNFRNAYTSHFWLFGQRICWLLQEDCRVWKHKQLSSKSNSEPGLTLTCFAKGVWYTPQDSQQPDRQSVDLQFQLFSEETQMAKKFGVVGSDLYHNVAKVLPLLQSQS